LQEQQDVKVVELDQDPWINKERREFRGIWDQDEVRVPLTAYRCNWSIRDVVEDQDPRIYKKRNRRQGFGGQIRQ